MSTCTPRSPAAVATRVQEIYRILRNDARCSGPVGLLHHTATHKADNVRVMHRTCNASVAETLGWSETTSWRAAVAWDEDRERDYPSKGASLKIGRVGFRAAFMMDAIIYDLFFNGAPLRRRRYFEMGARDGLVESNSLFFERHFGWSGVLVEPTPMAKCLIPRHRPRATVVHGAIGPPGGHLQITPGSKNMFMPAEWPDDCKLAQSDWRAPFYSWRNLSVTHDLNTVDLFSLDMDNEKAMKMVFQEIDWEHFRPTVIIVECQHRDCEMLFREHGYHTLVLENNGKRTYYGDVLAWKHPCAAH